MNKIVKMVLLGIGGLVLAGLLFAGGLFAGRMSLNLPAFGPGPGNSMMGRNGSGFGMMGRFWGGSNGRNGPQNNFMMGKGFNPAPNNAANSKPLSVDQAKQAVNDYLKGLNNADLELKEVMIFDNNAYARITEKSTGIGAMELLVDPNTLKAYPEYGPNIMWNQKYGQMGRFGGMMGGGRMGNQNNNGAASSGSMTITPENAVKIVQLYLDKQFPGQQADASADAFYGYYTIDILKDGKPVGMISVNGSSGQVFPHTWHGAFIEKSE